MKKRLAWKGYPYSITGLSRKKSEFAGVDFYVEYNTSRATWVLSAEACVEYSRLFDAERGAERFLERLAKVFEKEAK